VARPQCTQGRKEGTKKSGDTAAALCTQEGQRNEEREPAEFGYTAHQVPLQPPHVSTVSAHLKPLDMKTGAPHSPQGPLKQQYVPLFASNTGLAVGPVAGIGVGAVGALVGLGVGSKLGVPVVDSALGALLGFGVGSTVGVPVVGSALGMLEGLGVGSTVGVPVVGSVLGMPEGLGVGSPVGPAIGALLNQLGRKLGLGVGLTVGVPVVGSALGVLLGLGVGSTVGVPVVGSVLGMLEGLGVGSPVGVSVSAGTVVGMAVGSRGHQTAVSPQPLQLSSLMAQ